MTQSLNMNQNNQHCFLLDGKTILPIDHFLSVKNQYCSCSLQSMNKYIAKENICKHHQSDQEINNNQSPLAITIIIKPFISSENHREDTSVNEKSSLLKKRKNSSSRKSPTKRISSCLSDQIVTKHRFSTFKDTTRLIRTKINFDENRSSNILNSRTLLDIYRNKKIKK